MPLVGEHHVRYWEFSSTSTTPLAEQRIGHYPAWQSGVVMGSAFGVVVSGLVLWCERLWDRVRWWWRAQPRVMRLDAEARLVLLRTLDALEHPAYPIARQSVRRTATTLGFNRPEAWKELSRELKGSAGHAENAFRHLEACRLVRANLINSTVTNPECHLIVELAYHGFAARGR